MIDMVPPPSPILDLSGVSLAALRTMDSAALHAAQEAVIKQSIRPVVVTASGSQGAQRID